MQFEMPTYLLQKLSFQRETGVAELKQHEVEMRMLENRILSYFKNMAIYDTPKMIKDFENMPDFNPANLSWHPAAYYLRTNNNYLALPFCYKQNSDRYGMRDKDFFEQFFANKLNYPKNYLKNYGYYHPPIIDLATLRKYHDF